MGTMIDCLHSLAITTCLVFPQPDRQDADAPVPSQVEII